MVALVVGDYQNDVGRTFARKSFRQARASGHGQGRQPKARRFQIFASIHHSRDTLSK
jgi:hypothetical protein